MPPSGPPPASAMPIRLFAEHARLAATLRALRRRLPSRILVFTFVGKSPSTGAIQGLLVWLQLSVTDQRVDLRPPLRVADFVGLRDAFDAFVACALGALTT